jgi:hypothetical protein
MLVEFLLLVSVLFQFVPWWVERIVGGLRVKGFVCRLIVFTSFVHTASQLYLQISHWIIYGEIAVAVSTMSCCNFICGF